MSIAPPTEKHYEKGDFAPIKFYGKLRRYQRIFLDKAINLSGEKIRWNYDKIFEVPCGHGKTIMALFLAALLQRKMLVFVSTNYLAEQWKDKAKIACKEDALILNKKIDSIKTVCKSALKKLQ